MSLVPCKKCGKPAFKDDLCKVDFVKAVWLDNSSLDNMGIFLFFKKIIPQAFKSFKYGIPRFHREILFDVLQDRPEWKINNRKIVVAAPRGSSKTTLISKGLVLYCVVFGLKKYIVISSKTGRAAQKNLRWLRQMLAKSVIINLFGDLRPDRAGVSRATTDEVEGVWTNSIIVLKNGVTVEAIGMGQQLRSSAEGEDVNRIDLFIADDTETNENTKTPERREDNEDWLFETVIPSIDIDTGTIVFINTLAHTESILSKLLKSEDWRKRFYQISFRNTKGVEESLWPEKFPLDFIDSLRKDYQMVGRLRSFYKEYYNVIRSDEGFSDRWFRYHNGTVFEFAGRNWIKLPRRGDVQEQTLPVYMGLGIDFAYSVGEGSDFNALVPIATAPDFRKFVMPIVRAKMTTYDDIDSSGRVIRKGVIDEVLRLHRLYKFQLIVAGRNGGDNTLFDLLKRALQGEPHPPRIMSFTATRATADKIQRCKDVLQPEYESGRVYHIYGTHDDLERELISLGDSTDDIIDALHNIVKLTNVPDDVEYNSSLVDRRIIDRHKERERSKNISWITL